MCQHGQETICRVWVCAEDSHTGAGRWADKAVDACLADQVNALNAAGRLTRTCCCGHGKGGGAIVLHDGTEIPITPNAEQQPRREAT
jgi:hypothetical protein